MTKILYYNIPFTTAAENYYQINSFLRNSQNMVFSQPYVHRAKPGILDFKNYAFIA